MRVELGLVAVVWAAVAVAGPRAHAAPGPAGTPPAHGAGHPAVPPGTALPAGHPPVSVGRELRLEALARLEAGDGEGARAYTRALLQAEPRSSEAWRFAFFVYRGLARWSEAEEAIGEAVRWAPDASGAASLLAERAELHRVRGRLEEAEDDVRAVLREQPDHPQALEEGVHVALGRGEAELARRRLQRLEGVAGAELSVLRAHVLAGEGRLDAALGWARRAAAGPEPTAGEAQGLVQRLEAVALQARTRPALRGLLTVGVLLAALVGWLLLVLLPLSLRERRRLGAGPGAAGVLALRGAVAGMGALVRLLPVVALVPVLWPLSGLLAVGPRLDLALALGVLATPAVATLTAWGRAMATRHLTVELGPPLALEEHPALAAELAEAARQAGVPLPARVHLTPDASLHTLETGPLWRLLSGRGEWTLVLGLARLAGTPRGELRALLVEALAPASVGGGLLREEARVSLALRFLGEALHRQPLAVLNPFLHLLSLLTELYEAARAGVLRAAAAHVELRAAQAAGGAALVAGRQRGGLLRGRYDRGANRLVPLLVRAGHPCEDLYRLLPAVEEGLAPVPPTGDGDGEGLPAARLLAVEAAAGAPPPGADLPAVSLLAGGGTALARAYTAAWVERLRRGLASASLRVCPPAPPVSPEQELTRFAALARFDAALSRRRAAPPPPPAAPAPAPTPAAPTPAAAAPAAPTPAAQAPAAPVTPQAREDSADGEGAAEAPADAELQSALAALEAAVGARDALLGLALKELALTQALGGERARAAQTLRRALEADGARRFQGLLEAWRQVA
jgi:hypothetical protein